MADQSGNAAVRAASGRAGPALERIAKPWGEELILARSAERVVKALRIRPHQRLSLQFHRRKHETLMLIGGGALLTLDARAAPTRLGVPAQIAAGVIHRLSAGPDGADVLEIASRLPDDAEDIVRLADDYGRADRPGRG